MIKIDVGRLSNDEHKMCCATWVGERGLYLVGAAASFPEISGYPTFKEQFKRNSSLARLIENVGIDDVNDFLKFMEWWKRDGKRYAPVMAYTARVLGLTFHQVVTESFLDWLEPVSEELDSGTNLGYADMRSERCFVMGENHSVVILTTFDDYGEGARFDLVFDGSSYPVRQSFFDVREAIEGINRYVNRA